MCRVWARAWAVGFRVDLRPGVVAEIGVFVWHLDKPETLNP